MKATRAGRTPTGQREPSGPQAVTRRDAGLPTGRVASRSAGQPLDRATGAFMEERFGHDFSTVRIHTDPEAAAAARRLHARAYTIGDHIAFDANRYRPSTASGRLLLAHELAHVVQQRGGGSSPSLDPGAAHERDAARAAQAAVGGARPAVVQVATGAGIARSVDDWLESTPDISQWTYTELLDEIDEIQQWLGNQFQTTPESARLEEAVETLRAEANRRERTALRNRRGRGRGRRKKKNAEVRAEEPDMEKPRILREGTSIVYEDPAELRAEVDRIVTWLGRTDLTGDERDILKTELQNLAPELQESRMQRVAGRRAEKIQQALTPQESDDARAQLIEAVSLIAGIRPMSDRPGYSYLLYGDEMLILSNEEAQMIRDGIVGMMDRAVKKIAEVRQSALDNYGHQSEINRDQWFVSGVVDLVGGEETNDPFYRVIMSTSKAQLAMDAYQRFRRASNLVAMAGAIADAEAEASAAKLAVDRWVQSSISTAGSIVVGLTITRDLSFSIVTSYFAGAGFVSLARSGVGLLRAGATVTALGTGGNALVGGGTNLVGQAIAGDVDYGEVGREALARGKRGLVDSTVGIVTAGTGSALGEGATTAQRVWRGAASGSAGGTTGGALEATLEGKSAGEVLTSAGKGGLSGAISGGFGGLFNLSGRSDTAKFLLGAGTGGAGDFFGTLAVTGSTEEATRAGLISAATGGLTSVARPSTRGASQGETSDMAADRRQTGGEEQPALTQSKGDSSSPGDSPAGADLDLPSLELDTGPWQARDVAYNEIDLGPTPDASGLSLDRGDRSAGSEIAASEAGSGPGRDVGLSHNEIDLGPTPDIDDLKLYRGSKPVDQIPGIKRPERTFGEASTESSGTFNRTGMHFNELNSAEIAAGVRVDYDPVAGRPRFVRYRIDAEAAQRRPETERSFTQDVSTEGAQPRHGSFTNTGYERGHLIQREAVRGDADVEAAVDQLTAVVPMTSTLNRGQGSPWRASESRAMRLAQEYGSIVVEVEPVYAPDPPRLPDGTPIPTAIRRRILSPDGQVLEDASYLNR